MPDTDTKNYTWLAVATEAIFLNGVASQPRLIDSDLKVASHEIAALRTDTGQVDPVLWHENPGGGEITTRYQFASLSTDNKIIKDATSCRPQPLSVRTDRCCR